jgi:hypothetical protein
MERPHGHPAGALTDRLLPFVAVALVVWAVASLVLSALVPSMTPFAPFVGLLVAFGLLRDTRFMSRVWAVGRRTAGELDVAGYLAGLPAGWRVFHDVPLDRETIRHVVVSNRGVFTIEVDGASGSVAVLGESIVCSGRAKDDVVRRLARQRFKLGRRLGVEVRSILVFTGADPGDHAVGGTILTSADRLPEILAFQREGVLALDEGRRVFELLNAMISRTVRAAALESSPPRGSATGST